MWLVVWLCLYISLKLTPKSTSIHNRCPMSCDEKQRPLRQMFGQLLHIANWEEHLANVSRWFGFSWTENLLSYPELFGSWDLIRTVNRSLLLHCVCVYLFPALLFSGGAPPLLTIQCYDTRIFSQVVNIFLLCCLPSCIKKQTYCTSSVVQFMSEWLLSWFFQWIGQIICFNQSNESYAESFKEVTNLTSK